MSKTVSNNTSSTEGGAAPGRKRRAAEIIDAAAAVFAEKSYHGAATQDIAARLGMRQASLYYYLHSKEDALAQVCKLGVEGFLEFAQEIAARRHTAAERIAAIVGRHLGSNDVRPDYTKVFLTERQHLPMASRKAIGRSARAYEKVIEGVIREGVAAGEFAAGTNPRLATLALLGMCNEATKWIKTRRGASVPATTDAFCCLLLRGMATRSASAKPSLSVGAPRGRRPPPQPKRRG